jgi:hypothetical protein
VLRPLSTQQRRRDHNGGGTSEREFENTAARPHSDGNKEAPSRIAATTKTNLTEALTEEKLLDSNRDIPGYYTLNSSPDLSCKPLSSQCSSSRNPLSTPSLNFRMLILQAYYHVSHKMNRGYAQKCLCPVKVSIVTLKSLNNYLIQNSNTHTNSNIVSITPVCMQVLRMYAKKSSLSMQIQKFPLRMHDQELPLNTNAQNPSLKMHVQKSSLRMHVNKSSLRMHVNNSSLRMYVRNTYSRMRMQIQELLLRMNASLNILNKSQKNFNVTYSTFLEKSATHCSFMYVCMYVWNGPLLYLCH